MPNHFKLAELSSLAISSKQRQAATSQDLKELLSQIRRSDATPEAVERTRLMYEHSVVLQRNLESLTMYCEGEGALADLRIPHSENPRLQNDQ